MFKEKAKKILADAGIAINGKNPWDMIVYSDDVLRRAIWSGNLGLGETYMDGLWDCVKLDDLFCRLVRADAGGKSYASVANVLLVISSLFLNAQKISRAFRAGWRHYDIGNDLFKAMLDQTMSYSCGYWRKAKNLNQAQLDKLDLICRKIKLAKQEAVLDIGCGWEGFVKYASSRYQAKITGLTVSKEQADLARQRCNNLPVTILLEDYRQYQPTVIFDKVISVGMFEHVGPKNYRRFMEVVAHCLKDDGIFLLHTIGSLKSRRHTDHWLEKYIFPNGVIPSLRQIYDAANGIFVKLDEHEFGRDYDLTLMAWWKNFESAWPELSKNPKYNERFHRMWRYYLLSCAGAFRAGKLKLYQIVFARPGRIKNYTPVR